MSEAIHSYKHIVVVHGIGDQAPNETALRFMSELLRVMKESSPNLSIEVENFIESVDDIKDAKADVTDVTAKFLEVIKESLPNLSGNSTKRVGDTKDAKQEIPKPTRSFTPAFVVIKDNDNENTHVVGFSEVYWKQIPDEFIKNNADNLPIPVFAWARSINTRFLADNGELAKRPGEDYRQKQAYIKKIKKRQSDFSGWTLAIDNLEKIMKHLKRLVRLIKKEKQFSMFTERFLGDVQIYSESKEIKNLIDNRFLDVMSRIKDFSEAAKTEKGISKFDSTGIYIIAHSEGTVVTYCCLVKAALAVKRGNADKDWLKNVKGLLTIGSPLDKHFTIWRNRFRKNELEKELDELPEGVSKIPWFNYWDKSDPIGYGLRILFSQGNESTDEKKTDADKLFDVKADKGFRRYFVPVVAHNTYWKDKEIYKVIVKNLMGFTSSAEGKVEDKSWSIFHPLFATGSYFAIRAFLLAGLAFFLSKLLWPVLASSNMKSWPKDDLSLQIITESTSSSKLLWGVLFFLIGSVLSWIMDYGHYKMQKDGERRYDWVYWLRKIFMIVLVFGSTFICMANFRWFMPDNLDAIKVEVKDVVGYLTGGFIFFLLWKIHTSVFRVQVQLRKYVQGEDTQYMKKTGSQDTQAQNTGYKNVPERAEA